MNFRLNVSFEQIGELLLNMLVVSLVNLGELLLLNIKIVDLLLFVLFAIFVSNCLFLGLLLEIRGLTLALARLPKSRVQFMPWMLKL